MELIERCLKIIETHGREPEDWPVPISRDDLRKLVSSYISHNEIYVPNKYTITLPANSFKQYLYGEKKLEERFPESYSKTVLDFWESIV